MSKIIAVIPCRYASSRFPGKPLALIGDKPMMWHVYQRAIESNVFDEIVIATEDDRILKVSKELQLDAVCTNANHRTGTDRVAEVSSQIEAEYYVNIQGDEPFIDPNSIKAVANKITDCSDPLIHAANAYTELDNINEILDVNNVKVVMNYKNLALAFSRYPVPYPKENHGKYCKQLGLYAFKKSGLQKFIENKPLDIELTEGVEMYRLLEHGYQIQMILTKDSSISVDTPADLMRAENLFNLENFEY